MTCQRYGCPHEQPRMQYSGSKGTVHGPHFFSLLWSLHASATCSCLFEGCASSNANDSLNKCRHRKYVGNELLVNSRAASAACQRSAGGRLCRRRAATPALGRKHTRRSSYERYVAANRRSHVSAQVLKYAGRWIHITTAQNFAGGYSCGTHDETLGPAAHSDTTDIARQIPHKIKMQTNIQTFTLCRC